MAGADIERSEQDRETHMCELADKLMFKVERQSGTGGGGARFTLIRTMDVSQPVHETNLTLAQAEELLNTWKLRGPHGG